MYVPPFLPNNINYFMNNLGAMQFLIEKERIFLNSEEKGKHVIQEFDISRNTYFYDIDDSDVYVAKKFSKKISLYHSER